MGLRQAPQNGLGVAPLPGWLSQTVGHAMACASSYVLAHLQQLLTCVLVVLSVQVRLQQMCSCKMDSS